MKNQETPTIQPITYDGRLGELYKIFLLNLFLGIITLGIYHFWGKTRKRRYETSSFMIGQDRLEYTGYGSELFWGFIKALVILAIISAPYYWFYHKNSAVFDRINAKMEEVSERHQKAAKEEQERVEKQLEDIKAGKQPAGSIVAPKESQYFDDLMSSLTPDEKKLFMQLLVAIGIYMIFYFLYLPFVAMYGSLRYRVTRTRWRGIRGHLTGSSLIYGIVGMFHLFLKWITLGLWIPFGDLMVWKYKMNRLSFGNQPGNFEPRYGRLFWSHLSTVLVALILSVALIGGWVFLAGTASAAESTKISPEHALLALGFFSILPIFLVLLLIARNWYRASLLRLQYNGLTFGNMGFRCTITGWQLLRQRWGNILILIFTLGLGMPIVIQRRQKFFTKHVQLIGDIENTSIMQAAGEKDKWGEGLSTVFDLEIGLF